MPEIYVYQKNGLTNFELIFILLFVFVILIFIPYLIYTAFFLEERTNRIDSAFNKFEEEWNMGGNEDEIQSDSNNLPDNTDLTDSNNLPDNNNSPDINNSLDINNQYGNNNQNFDPFKGKLKNIFEKFDDRINQNYRINELINRNLILENQLKTTNMNLVSLQNMTVDFMESAKLQIDMVQSLLNPTKIIDAGSLNLNGTNSSMIHLTNEHNYSKYLLNFENSNNLIESANNKIIYNDDTSLLVRCKVLESHCNSGENYYIQLSKVKSKN